MVSKELADLFEAVARLIFEDSKSLMTVWGSFYPFFKDVLSTTKQLSIMQVVIKWSVFLSLLEHYDVKNADNSMAELVKKKPTGTDAVFR